MKSWLIRIFVNACALAAAAWLFKGIRITGNSDRDQVITLLVIALIFGIVNEFVRPIVAFLSLPLYLITLGLMFFVVNALMLLLTSWIADQLDIGFHVRGFWTAVWGSIVISIVSWIVGLVAPAHDG
ncbi:MAG: phage holin family protein [Nocardioidaceae bacterium]